MCSIYFLDATVIELSVNERIVRDADGDTDFAVVIDLLNLPSLIVRRTELVECIERQDDLCCIVNLDYNAGCARYFTAKRSMIVDGLKRNPLRIEIYRAGERFPVCHGIVPFSGCACDMMSEAMEYPSPFEFGGTFDLVDPGKSPAGQIVLSLVLTELGRYLVNPYVLDRDAFLLKTHLEGPEYKCTSIKNSKDHQNPPSPSNSCCPSNTPPENLMREIVGISLAAQNLSLGKPPAKRVYEPLEVPNEVKANTGKAKKSAKKSRKKSKR